MKINRTFFITLSGVAILLIGRLVQAENLYINKVSAEARGDILSDATMVISWYTNLPSRGRVDFGVTTDYGRYIGSSESPGTYHEIKLANLKSETTYHYKIIAVTVDGLKVESFDQTFKTPKYKDSSDPIISDVNVTYSGATYFVVTWRTERPSDGDIEYSADESLKRPSRASGGSNVLVHEAVITRLKKNTAYYFRVKISNRDNYEWFSSPQKVFTASDDSADKANLILDRISPASSYDAGISNNSVNVSWRTSRPARGSVEYWSDAKSARHSKVDETGFYKTDHSITLINLTPGTRYKFKIQTKDVLGKSTKTTDLIMATKTATGEALGEVPPAVAGCSNSGIYGGWCRNLNNERNLAVQLRGVLWNVFSGRVPLSANNHWFALVKAYVYGGYPPEAIVQAVKFGGKTVHPAIPWSEWKESDDYKNYISR